MIVHYKSYLELKGERRLLLEQIKELVKDARGSKDPVERNRCLIKALLKCQDLERCL